MGEERAFKEGDFDLQCEYFITRRNEMIVTSEPKQIQQVQVRNCSCVLVLNRSVEEADRATSLSGLYLFVWSMVNGQR